MNRFTNFIADHSRTILLATAVAIATIGACTSAHASKCRANDKWTGPDKQQHFWIGAGIGMAATLNAGDWRDGLIWGTAIGAAKELADASGMGDCSAQDFLVTVTGAAVGSLIGRGLYLTFDPRAKQVLVGINVEIK